MKNIVKYGGILILLCLLLFETNNLYSYKHDDGIYNLKTYYEQEENTVDVLVNREGVEMFTPFWGEFLTNTYEFQDRRGDENYISWQKEVDYKKQIENNKNLKECVNIEDYLDLLNNPNYKIVVSTAGEYLSETYLEKMELVGIDSLLYAAGGAFILQNGQILHYSGTNEDYFYHEEWGDSDIALKKTLDVSTTGEERPAYEMMIDLVEYRVVGNGINILVWDELSQSVVDAVGFYAYNGWGFERKE